MVNLKDTSDEQYFQKNSFEFILKLADMCKQSLHIPLYCT